jgi:hypothetical protein
MDLSACIHKIRKIPNLMEDPDIMDRIKEQEEAEKARMGRPRKKRRTTTRKRRPGKSVRPSSGKVPSAASPDPSRDSVDPSEDPGKRTSAPSICNYEKAGSKILGHSCRFVRPFWSLSG